MKIKIQKWYQPLTTTWESKCGCISLICRSSWWYRDRMFQSQKWICSVTYGPVKRVGLHRSSSDRAKQDAEYLIRELLLDIVSSTQQLIRQYDIKEDD